MKHNTNSKRLPCNICTSRSQVAILLILIILCTNQLQTRKPDFPSTVPTRDCTSLCVCILYRLERNTVKKLIPHCCHTETLNIKVTECKSKHPGILSSSQTVSRERSGTIQSSSIISHQISLYHRLGSTAFIYFNLQQRGQPSTGLWQ